MSTSSKKPKPKSKSEQRAQKKAKRTEKYLLGVEEAVQRLTGLGDGPIPPTVATSRDMKDTPEEADILYTLAFKELDDRKCDLASMGTGDAGSLLRKFRDISHASPSTARQRGVFRDKIERGDRRYGFLFANLSPDVTLLEVQFAQEGRIFCHSSGKHLSVVAVRARHINLG